MSEEYNKIDHGAKNRQKVFRLLYHGLIGFYIFTFIATLVDLDGENATFPFIHMSTDIVVLFLIWIILAIHLFSSYLRVDNVSQESYPIVTFISDSIEVALMIVLTISISNSISRGGNYLFIYKVVELIVLNQLFWFISVNLWDKRSFIRILIVLLSLFGLSLWEYLSWTWESYCFCGSIGYYGANVSFG